DAVKLSIGGRSSFYIDLLAVVGATTQVFMTYRLYAALLKWLTVSLLAYIAALAVINVPWAAALRGVFVPSIIWGGDFLATLVAIFGTTISPYLFFRQASQEPENQRINQYEKPLVKAPHQAPEAFERIRVDTLVGMAFSNIIALAIIIVTAATLHEKGITKIETPAQAAEGLRPIAGEL